MTLALGAVRLERPELATRIRGALHDGSVILVADAGFGWEEVAAANQSLSLFGSKRVIDLRLPTGKPGTEGAKVLAGGQSLIPLMKLRFANPTHLVDLNFAPPTAASQTIS